MQAKTSKRFGIRAKLWLVAFALLLGLGVAVVVAPQAALAAGPITLTNVDGVWGNAQGVGGCSPITNLSWHNTGDTTDENQVRYGNPASGPLGSGFGFDGRTPGGGDTGVINDGDIFLLGEFTHYNNPITVSCGLETTDLVITLYIAGVSPNPTLTYTMHLDETPNGADPCEYEDPDCAPGSCPNDNGCCDKVWFSPVGNPTFEVNGTQYELQITGFVPKGDLGGDTCPLTDGTGQEAYFTEEANTNRACLYAQLIGEECDPKMTLTPESEGNILPADDTHTVYATVTDCDDNPLFGETVDFIVVDGPNTGQTGTGVTNASGVASWTYTSNGIVGIDKITAVGDDGSIDGLVPTTPAGGDEFVFKVWSSAPPPPAPGMTVWGILATVLALGGLTVVMLRRRQAHIAG